jgi:hypothetical protein
MPHAAGFCYIVQSQCLLTAWPEWHALQVETGQTLATFIFKDILCRWGAVERIVTDNSTAFVAALNTLANQYGIRHIHILAYNSCANRIVERQHCTIHESLVKACKGNIAKWPTLAPMCSGPTTSQQEKQPGTCPFTWLTVWSPFFPLTLH